LYDCPFKAFKDRKSYEHNGQAQGNAAHGNARYEYREATTGLIAKLLGNMARKRDSQSGMR